MLRKLLFGTLITIGMCVTGSEAKAHYPYGGGYYAGHRPYYGAPYYGSRYYGTPYRGYGPYYNYGYRYYANPYYAYPVYASPAPVYYGPRVGVTYVTPRVGIAIGF